MQSPPTTSLSLLSLYCTVLYSHSSLSCRFPGAEGASEQPVSPAGWRRRREEALGGVPAQLQEHQQLQPGTSTRAEGGAGQGDQSCTSHWGAVWPAGQRQAPSGDHQQVQWTDQRGNYHSAPFCSHSNLQLLKVPY